jgi:hypothetical protein
MKPDVKLVRVSGNVSMEWGVESADCELRSGQGGDNRLLTSSLWLRLLRYSTSGQLVISFV